MSTVSTKTYVCSLCNKESEHSTNHDSEIYVKCKECYNDTLYPKDDKREFVPMFIFKYYYFNIEKTQDKKDYSDMVTSLNKQGVDKWGIYVPYYAANVHKISRKLKEQDGKTISVHSPESFDNQFITNIGRLHSWAEFGWDNQNIKEGYYLQRI